MKKEKLYVTLSDCSNKLDILFAKGMVKGFYCGFEQLYEYYSPLMGGTTYVYANPFSGKTEFWFEVLMSLSELHGMKHAVYSPETGSAEDIYAELISKAARKPFYKQIQGAMGDSDYQRWKEWVGHHFVVIDPQETDLSVKEFYAQVDMIEEDLGIKINTTTTDPFNEMKHDLQDKRQDLYIEEILGFIRRNAREKKRHNAVITHTASQEIIKDVTVDGKNAYFNPAPNPNKLSGGLAWNRKAMNLLAIWRPPVGVLDPDTNEPHKENEVHIIIQKYKPKGTGRKGTVRWFFDIHQNRFYEINNGNRKYSEKQPEKPTYTHIGASDVNF